MGDDTRGFINGQAVEGFEVTVKNTRQPVYYDAALTPKEFVTSASFEAHVEITTGRLSPAARRGQPCSRSLRRRAGAIIRWH